jgi:small GTP-binding protein
MNETYDHLFKFVILGDSNVGKSSLLSRFAEDRFDDHYQRYNIGREFYVHTVDHAGQRLKLHLWDTGGQERFMRSNFGFPRLLCRGAQGIFLVYDVTDASSFANVQAWYDRLDQASLSGLTFVLLGNKCDLAEAQRQVPTEQAQAFADGLGMHFFETSAKSPINVEQAFRHLTAEVYRRAVGRSVHRPGGVKLPLPGAELAAARVPTGHEPDGSSEPGWLRRWFGWISS